MRKSMILLAALVSAALTADTASAAKSFAQCGADFNACQISCAGTSDAFWRKACFNKCENVRKA